MPQENSGKFVVLCGAAQMTTTNDIHGFAQIGGIPVFMWALGMRREKWMYGNSRLTIGGTWTC